MMNVYDFDKTIYWDDCATDFYKFALKKKPTLIRYWPQLMKDYWLFKKKKLSRTQLKETLYQYVCHLENLDQLVEEFWMRHEHKIKDWYFENKKEDDLIISASPEFLIKPICNQLKIRSIASKLDVKTGKYEGLNCYGESKVERFYQEYPNELIDLFYSDSLSDTPLAKLAKKAFIVKGEEIIPWPEETLADTEKEWM